MNPYCDEIDEVEGWEEFCCIRAKNVIILVRKAEGGEQYGHQDFNHRAKAGENLCMNPKNGHRWVMDNEALEEFYVKRGCLPPVKSKKKR